MSEAAISHSPNGHSPPLPDELQAYDQWINYRLETKPDGKLDKIPTDRDRKLDIPKTAPGYWLSCEKAYRYAATKDHLSGAGFVLTDNDPFACIDLDDCRDPETEIIEYWALRYVYKLDSYTEVSASGKGIHIFVRGNVTGKTKFQIDGHTIETYSRNRFIAVTGDQVTTAPDHIADGQSLLDAFAQHAPDVPHAVYTAGIPEPPEWVTADHIIEKLDNASNADKFRRLFYEGATDGDASSADITLACLVVFYTGGNVELAEDVMRRSALNRDKWDKHRTYLTGLTIPNAISRQSEFYDWNRSETLSDNSRLGVLRNYQKETYASEKVSDNSQTPNTEENQKRMVFRSAREIAEQSSEQTRWTVKPWIGPGLITEIIEPPKKSGKTTWLTHAARCVLDGLPFMGEPTEKGPVVYLTEQPASSFREALKDADLLDREDFAVLTWGDTAGAKWPDVAALAAEEAERIGAKMLVVDTLSPFAGLKGDAENNAGDAMAAVEPLKRAAHNHDLAVVMVRHARKGGGDVGESGRGSSAFLAEVDIHISITKASGNNPKARKIETLTRFSAVPSELHIELTDSGYKAYGSDGQVKKAGTIETICDLLPHTRAEAMPEKDILDRIDASRKTVKDVLTDLYHAAVIDCEGTGVRGDPYRYYYSPFLAIQDYNESGQLIDIWTNPHVPNAA